jgi:hypothetical protein
MHPLFECREDRLGMQMIRRGHCKYIEIREVLQDRMPRFIAVIGTRLVVGERLEVRRSLLGGLLRARGNGDQRELDGREVAIPQVEPDPCKLAGDAEALQVGISAGVDIAAEHAGADEGDLEGLGHG